MKNQLCTKKLARVHLLATKKIYVFFKYLLENLKIFALNSLRRHLLLKCTRLVLLDENSPSAPLRKTTKVILIMKVVSPMNGWRNDFRSSRIISAYLTFCSAGHKWAFQKSWPKLNLLAIEG